MFTMYSPKLSPSLKSALGVDAMLSKPDDMGHLIESISITKGSFKATKLVSHFVTDLPSVRYFILTKTEVLSPILVDDCDSGDQS
jgi:hypothetical protein